MKDSLSYRISDDGEAAFNSAINKAKRWIAANIQGPLKMTFSISIKAVGAEGESVQEANETTPLPLIDARSNGGKTTLDTDLSRECARRHHKGCKYAACQCTCGHPGRDDAEGKDDGGE